MEKGHEIRYLDSYKAVYVRFNYNSSQGIRKMKLDLVGVQEVRWDKGGTVKAGDYNFFYGKGKENYQLGKDIPQNSISR